MLRIPSLVTVAILALGALPALGAEPIRIVTAENFYGDLVRQIGGTHVEVTSILANPDEDPHLFESSPSTALMLADAQIVIYNGAGYDPWMDRLLGASASQSRTALSQISEELPEAARMCGASPLRAFYDVTVPLVQPAALALWTLLFMSIFTEISVTILLYNYNTITLPVQLWNDMSAGHQTRAFATAMLQASVIFIVIFAANRKFGILRNTLGR